MTRVARALAVLGICWMALGPAAAVSAAPDKRPITEKDLFRFTWAADPQMSPDGSRVVFVKVVVNESKDTYETSLWTVPTRGDQAPQRLTNGPRDTTPRWATDGKRLAFLRGSEKDGKPQPSQIYVLSFAGGEPWALTSLPKGAQSPAWSPDGKQIAFLSDTSAADLAKLERKAKEHPESKDEKPAERESDVRVITHAVYRMNGEGYLDPKHPGHVWTVAVPDTPEGIQPPRPLTTGPYDEDEPTWSPDGSRIYFTSTRSVEPYYEPRQNELFFIPAAGGEITKVTSIQGDLGELSVSRDGRMIAFRGMLSQPSQSYTQPDLYVVAATPGAAPRNLTAAYDYDVGSGLIADQRPPRGGGGSRPLWSRDGRSLIDKVARLGRANLETFDVATGKVSSFTTGDQEIVSFTASQDGSRLALLLSTTTNIGDIVVAEAAGGPLRQLTHVNEKLLSELNLTLPEEIWYTSFDGRKIQAWVQKPPDFDPHKKYPLILNIHGGPHTAYGYTFFHEIQWMAAKGYVVLYPNPRGSTSYGQEFGNIIQYRYPGDDYKDLMAGVDEMIRRGYVDPQRLGVTGGSGGGLLTNWVITQTGRFAAAVAQRDIADWAAWWYSADFTLFQPNWFKAPPFEDPADYAARSPITYITKVKTPLMLILGDADFRTPTGAGGETMFRALKFLKVPTVMVRFPGESHELSRSGKPWHRVERLEHILNWFDKYLQGKKVAGYEVVPTEEESGAAKP